MNTSHKITSHFGRQKKRYVELKIGDRYVVEPLNSLKKKHRGRICTILDFDDNMNPSFAIVKFDDTNRIGKVDISDLVLIN